MPGIKPAKGMNQDSTDHLKSKSGTGLSQSAQWAHSVEGGERIYVHLIFH